MILIKNMLFLSLLIIELSILPAAAQNNKYATDNGTVKILKVYKDSAVEGGILVLLKIHQEENPKKNLFPLLDFTSPDLSQQEYREEHYKQNYKQFITEFNRPKSQEVLVKHPTEIAWLDILIQEKYELSYLQKKILCMQDDPLISCADIRASSYDEALKRVHYLSKKEKARNFFLKI
jgi:hypothetical protein